MANRGKNAPSRGEPSTAEIEAEVLRKDTVSKFHELALDALEFKQGFPRFVSARRPLTIPRALKSVRRMGAGATKLRPAVREWRIESRKLWKRLITQLAEIRTSLPWIQRQMREANKLIALHCRTWIGVAAELTERVMVDCDAKMRMESVARVWHENEGAILRAQFLALSHVRRLAKRENGSPSKQKSKILHAVPPPWSELQNKKAIKRAEAAGYLRLSDRTIRDYIRRGKLDATRLGWVICNGKLLGLLRRALGDAYR